MRFRNLALIGGTATLLAYTSIAHPGAQTVEEHLIVLLAILAKLAMPVVAVLFALIARKALLDYKGFDLEDFIRKGKETATGSAIIFLGVCILMFGLLGLFGNQVNAQSVFTYVPERAHVYLPQLKKEQSKYWADHPKATRSLALSSTKAVLV